MYEICARREIGKQCLSFYLNLYITKRWQEKYFLHCLAALKTKKKLIIKVLLRILFIVNKVLFYTNKNNFWKERYNAFKNSWCFEKTVLQRRSLGNPIFINFAFHESALGSQVLSSSVYFWHLHEAVARKKRIKTGAEVCDFQYIFFCYFSQVELFV